MFSKLLHMPLCIQCVPPPPKWPGYETKRRGTYKLPVWGLELKVQGVLYKCVRGIFAGFYIMVLFFNGNIQVSVHGVCALECTSYV